MPLLDRNPGKMSPIFVMWNKSVKSSNVGEMSPNFVANWHQKLGRKGSEFRGKLPPNTWAKYFRISWQIFGVWQIWR